MDIQEDRRTDIVFYRNSGILLYCKMNFLWVWGLQDDVAVAWIVIQYVRFSVYNRMTHGSIVKDGNSEIGPHVRINLCYLICLRSDQIESSQKSIFCSSEKTYIHLYLRIMF